MRGDRLLRLRGQIKTTLRVPIRQLPAKRYRIHPRNIVHRKAPRVQILHLLLTLSVRLNFRAAPRFIREDELDVQALRSHARRARLRWDGSRVYSPIAALRPIEW